MSLAPDSGPPSLVIQRVLLVGKTVPTDAAKDLVGKVAVGRLDAETDVNAVTRMYSRLEDALTALAEGDQPEYFDNLRQVAEPLVGKDKADAFLRDCGQGAPDVPNGDTAKLAMREVGCRLIALTFGDSTGRGGSLVGVTGSTTNHPAYTFIRAAARDVLERIYEGAVQDDGVTAHQAAGLITAINGIVAKNDPGTLKRDIIGLFKTHDNSELSKDNGYAGFIVARVLGAVARHPTGLGEVAKVLCDRLAVPYVPPGRGSSMPLGVVLGSNTGSTGGTAAAVSGMGVYAGATGAGGPGTIGGVGPSVGTQPNLYLDALRVASAAVQRECQALVALYDSRPSWTHAEWQVAANATLEGMRVAPTVPTAPATVGAPSYTPEELANGITRGFVNRYFVVDPMFSGDALGRVLWRNSLDVAATRLPWGVGLREFERVSQGSFINITAQVVASYIAYGNGVQYIIEAARRAPAGVGYAPPAPPPDPGPAPVPSHYQDLGHGKFVTDFTVPKHLETRLYDIAGGRLTICTEDRIMQLDIDVVVHESTGPGDHHRVATQSFRMHIPTTPHDSMMEVPKFADVVRQVVQGHITVTMSDHGNLDPRARMRMANIGSVLGLLHEVYDDFGSNFKVDLRAKGWGIETIVAHKTDFERDERLSAGDLDDGVVSALHGNSVSLDGIRVYACDLAAGGHVRHDSGSTHWGVELERAPILVTGTQFILFGTTDFARMGGTLTTFISPPATAVHGSGIPSGGNVEFKISNSRLMWPSLHGEFKRFSPITVQLLNPDWLGTKIDRDEWTPGIFRSMTLAEFDRKHQGRTNAPKATRRSGGEVTSPGETDFGDWRAAAGYLHLRGHDHQTAEKVIEGIRQRSYKFEYLNFKYLETTCSTDRLEGVLAILASPAMRPRIFREANPQTTRGASPFPDKSNLAGKHVIALGNNQGLRITVSKRDERVQGGGIKSFYDVTNIAFVEGISVVCDFEVTQKPGNRDHTTQNDARVLFIFDAVFDLIHGGGKSTGYRDVNSAAFDELVRVDADGNPVPRNEPPDPLPGRPHEVAGCVNRLLGLISGMDPESAPVRGGVIDIGRATRAYPEVSTLIANVKDDAGLTYLVREQYRRLVDEVLPVRTAAGRLWRRHKLFE